MAKPLSTLLKKVSPAVRAKAKAKAKVLSRDFKETVVARVQKQPAFARAMLHRMLSRTGNPGMDNLAAVFTAIQQWLHVQLKVKTVAA